MSSSVLKPICSEPACACKVNQGAAAALSGEAIDSCCRLGKLCTPLNKERPASAVFPVDAASVEFFAVLNCCDCKILEKGKPLPPSDGALPLPASELNRPLVLSDDNIAASTAFHYPVIVRLKEKVQRMGQHLRGLRGILFERR